MWTTIGHDKAVSMLRHSLQEERLSHAYLLVGPQHVGKMTLALDLARAVNCVGEEKPCGECGQCRRVSDALHADVRVVGIDAGPDGGRNRVVIGIDQVREAQREASLKPFEGRYRVFIFEGAEHLSEEAANGLLKTLEEPPEQVLLLLLATDAAALPPTVVSRCQQLELRPLPAFQIAQELATRYDADDEAAAEVARLSRGRIGWAFEAIEDPDILQRRSTRLQAFEEALQGRLEQRLSYLADLARRLAADRDIVRQEIGEWLEWWRDVLMIKEGGSSFVTNLSRMEPLGVVAKGLSLAQIGDAIRDVRDTLEYVERNVNLRLALEQLMMVLPRVQGHNLSDVVASSKLRSASSAGGGKTSGGEPYRSEKTSGL